MKSAPRIVWVVEEAHNINICIKFKQWIQSETEQGLERFCRINKQWEVIALEQLTSHIEQAYNNRDIYIDR